MNVGLASAMLGALAVVVGAFGTHALRSQLEPAKMELFETAARYQLVHALAAAFAADRAQRVRATPAAGWFLAGIVLFSGSLYGLALGAPRVLGAVTPFGGTAFIAGWVLLALSFRRRPQA